MGSNTHLCGLHSLSPTNSLASSRASSSRRPASRAGRGCARQQVLCDSRNMTTCSNMDRRNLGAGQGGALQHIQCKTLSGPLPLCELWGSPAIGGAPPLDLDRQRQ